ncbi:MAG TPA: hypothetical protein VM099_14630 [Gemmatimonadaceae bacterium]|nr:hypothetical protein [Gemmatimonadaceae bacterium]
MIKLPEFVDERFLTHRLRSTSTAGIATGIVAILLWLYRYLTEHVIHWDLLGIALTFIVVKYAVFAWYRLKD